MGSACRKKKKEPERRKVRRRRRRSTMVEKDNVDDIVRDPIAIDMTTLAETKVDATSLDGVVVITSGESAPRRPAPVLDSIEEYSSSSSEEEDDVVPLPVLVAVTTEPKDAASPSNKDEDDVESSDSDDESSDSGDDLKVPPRELVMSIEEGMGVVGVRVRAQPSNEEEDSSSDHLPEDLLNDDVVVDKEDKDLTIYIEKNQTIEEIDRNIITAIRKYAFYRKYIKNIVVEDRGFNRGGIHASKHGPTKKKYRQYIDRGLIGFLVDYGESDVAKEIYSIAYLKKRSGNTEDATYTLKRGGDSKRRRVQLGSYAAYADLIKKYEVNNAEELANIDW